MVTQKHPHKPHQEKENAATTTQQQPPLQSLFSYGHIQWDASILYHVLLLLYIPIGIYLIIVRFVFLFFLLILIIVTPDNFTFPPKVTNFLLIAFGFFVRVHGFKENCDNPTIVCCNHRTTFDVFPFMKLFNFDVLIDKGFFEASFLARKFKKIVGAIPLVRGHDQNDREKDKQVILAHLAKCKRPLLFFAEGWDTNGRVGLMIYQKFLFSLGKPVHPVALDVRVPILPLNPGMLGTSVIKEVLWLFFYPCTIWSLTFLPPQTKRADESEIDFARRAQVATANSLNITPQIILIKMP
eukprot:TRINITY_DN888_c0_g1_i3.p1 TRINITY_DN888_c0_g1~~TRINITY_DN888_c0_g1_i3.p1  ORF type:complete len:297 (+),score=46.04 TRINITY_DN888_c0_g1_i3:119-1009(+)